VNIQVKHEPADEDSSEIKHEEANECIDVHDRMIPPTCTRYHVSHVNLFHPSCLGEKQAHARTNMCV